MNSHINFDTLEYMDELKKSGMQEPQAQALTKATAKAFTQMIETNEIATKKDIDTLRMELQAFIVKTITTSILILGSIQTIFHFLK